jgi:hypothetical protein
VSRAEQFWREQAERSRAEVEAACVAVGKASFWLGPYPTLTPTDRLIRVRDVISELAAALNLDPIPPAPPARKGREHG